MNPNPAKNWSLVTGDILDVPADVLVCSANPFLTLSGGVGGAFLLRYGDEMQRFLEGYLSERELRHAKPGTIVEAPPFASPYQCVFHVVAVDGAYECPRERITSIVAEILRLAARRRARTIALPALATGYGRLTIAEFAAGLRPALAGEFDGIHVILVLRHEVDVDRVRSILS